MCGEHVTERTMEHFKSAAIIYKEDDVTRAIEVLTNES